MICNTLNAGHVVRCKYGYNPFHLQRRTGIDSPNAGMGNRTGEQACIEHALSLEILREPGFASYLAVYIRWRKILTDECIGHGRSAILSGRLRFILKQKEQSKNTICAGWVKRNGVSLKSSCF